MSTQPALTTLQCLKRFVRDDFNPKCDESLTRADKLWRAALMTRDAERVGRQP